MYARLLSLCSLFLLLCCTGCALQGGGQSNVVVVQQQPRARLLYVAIGASDTFGVGSDDPQTQAWPTDLAKDLGGGVRLVNLGIPNVHVHNALSDELPLALDTHPDLVTIWLAVNDLADNVPLDSYSHDLDLLLTRLQRANPHVRIAVANVPDLTLVPRFAAADTRALRAQIAAYNSAIATIVKRHNVLLVDLYQRWNDLANHPEYISNDGFHPNAIGYAAIAQVFYQVLQEHGQ
jgi:lysophospholipase L1-like esterase